MKNALQENELQGIVGGEGESYPDPKFNTGEEVLYIREARRGPGTIISREYRGIWIYSVSFLSGTIECREEDLSSTW